MLVFKIVPVLILGVSEEIRNYIFLNYFQKIFRPNRVTVAVSKSIKDAHLLALSVVVVQGHEPVTRLHVVVDCPAHSWL